MTCPNCGGPTKVTDTDKGEMSIRRRRECKDCGHRFTTYEVHSAHLKTWTGILNERVIDELWETGKKIGVAAQWLKELNNELNRRLVHLK